MNGYVYLMQPVDGGLVKIGYAKDPELRRKKIQRMSPLKLRLLATVPAGRRHESRLHRRYGGYRRWGEWFQLPEDVLKALVKEFVDGTRWLVEERPKWLEERAKLGQVKPAEPASLL
jgi:hypothetical protein